ncbi:S9 family peptidase [Aliikangiella marina]|uniref:S9 family peptidase n=1 Tax=Aliikangiella marina TaxID=1712262 RepID=A0A545T9M7_9GAMM|nr:S9 family peptidase [Aliikangiella marina]TQV73909.1 S9 family peptidase [Aliikangiella marina]
MRIKIHHIVLFLLLVISLQTNANNLSMTLDDFIRLPTQTNFQISPDGEKMSVIVKKDGEDLLVILDAKTRQPQKAFNVPGSGKGIGRVYWVNDTRLVYTVTVRYAWDKTLRDTGDLVGVNIDGSKHRYIFGQSAGEMQTGSRIKKNKAAYGNHEIIDMLEDDDEHILIAFYPWRIAGNFWVTNKDAKPKILKLNVYDGSRRQVGGLPMPLASALTDNNSITRFSVAVDKSNNLVLSYKADKDADWENFSLDNFEGKNVIPISFTEDNQSVYLSANVGEGTRALYLMNLNTKAIEKIFHDEKVNISEYIRDFSGKRIVAVGTNWDKPQYHYLDKKDKKAKLHKMLVSSFEGYDITITSSTEDESKVIVHVYSDTNPGDYYLFDTQKLSADYLVTTRPTIKLELMKPMNAVEIKTRDGVALNSFLTLPTKDAKNLPLVVLPHGGPHGVRDYWGFDWEVQLLANRGYAVLQVNYRGSGGFGTQFEEAGHGKWGTLMQDDLTDATKYMIEQGIADPKRICIYGASYGGYAALMGTVREPDLYKCAIGSVGVYDLPIMFEEGDIAESDSGQAYLKEVLGNDIEDQKRRSPVHNVDKIKAEILLIHGEEDERAPIEHAENLMEAFDKIDKSYEWLELGNEGHGYYDEDNRRKVYTKILNFLEKNIGS